MNAKHPNNEHLDNAHLDNAHPYTPLNQVKPSHDALVAVPDTAHDAAAGDTAEHDGSLTNLVVQPLTRDNLARARQHLNLRHPNSLFLLFRWLVRGSWALTKHEASKRIDYGSNHDVTLKDSTGDAKISLPINYAVGVSVFFPMAALLVWLFSKVSDYEFAITERHTALIESSSNALSPSHIEGAP